MDAGRSGTRQSDFSSTRDQDHLESRARTLFDGPYRNGPAMATATLLSPTAPHHPHQAYSPAGYSPTSIASMISPTTTGPRRTSDETETSHRQSLPSIRDVISGTKPGSYATPAASAAQSLPSPFATSAPPRAYSDVGSEKHVSPRTLQPPSSFPPRSEPMPAFSHPSRPGLSNRPPAPPPPPSLSAYPAQHPSPPRTMEHDEARRAEAQPFNGGYPHQPHQQPPPPPPPPPASNHYHMPVQLPPGQLPLPDFPVSPRQVGQLPSPYDPQRPPMYGEDRGNKYEATLNRALVAWSYGDTLNRVSGSAQAIYHFAEAFNAAAREQHGAQPIPSRLPTEDEVNDMLENAYMIKKCLDEMRGMVQQSRMNNERARETNVRKTFEEDDPMYGDGVKAQYGMGEVKRRRGQRAAPPGRCHSCNRIDTPEWRRGPDGARTLCNACGLHYAKLERKRQLEQRNIRPKPSDERA